MAEENTAFEEIRPRTNGHELRRREVRDRILDAAEGLVREAGAVTFSARELASRAGVSYATPFNHFGSRAGILDAVIERSLRDIARKTKVISDDPLDRLFEALEVVIRYYARRAGLYRPIFAAPHSHSSASPALARAIGQWKASLENAQSKGFIPKHRDIDAIAEQLEANWLGTASAWVHYSLTYTQWRDLAQYNLALTLCGVVTDGARPRAQRTARRLETAVRKHRTYRRV